MDETVMEFNEPWYNTCSKIGWAARIGNLEYLKRFIAENNPVDVADNRGWRPIHEAAAVADTPDCLAELLKHDDTYINWVTHENETALLLTCKRRQGPEANEFVELLLENGADPDLPDNESDSPLLEAIRNENEYIVKMLIFYGANVNVADCSGWSLLHEAATKRNPFFVKCLLRNGVNIDVRDECGMTPLFSAAQHGNEQCLNALLSAAKKKGILERVMNRGAEDWATPLMIAAQQGFVKCVKKLLAHGADPNLITSDNATALHMAVQANNTTCLELLLEKMNIEPMIKSFLPETYEYSGMICPLHLAVVWSSHASLRALLNAGFYPDSLYHCSDPGPTSRIPFLPDCETALSYAIFKKDKVSVAILLSAGASFNPPVQKAFHPILRAMDSHNMEAFHMLIDKGTDINFQRQIFLSNEVFLAALITGLNYLKPLLSYGCDPNLCFQSQCELFERCAGRLLRKENLSLRDFLKIIMPFIVISTPVQTSFRALSSRFQEDISDILEDIDCPSSLQQICTIKIRQHLYSIHGVKLPNVIELLPLPPVLIRSISCSFH